MSQQVDSILQQIAELDEDERLVLEQRLQERAEAEWQRESANAREVARQQGINQQTIDHALANLRYGS
jgi:hypothetical protein